MQKKSCTSELRGESNPSRYTLVELFRGAHSSAIWATYASPDELAQSHPALSQSECQISRLKKNSKSVETTRVSQKHQRHKTAPERKHSE